MTVASIDEQIAELKGLRAMAMDDEVEADARARAQANAVEIPDEFVPDEPGDVLDEAIKVLAAMPKGYGAARLQQLLKRGHVKAVRQFLYDACLQGKYAYEIDQLTHFDFSKLPENSRGIAKAAASTRRNLLSRMIMDADQFAAGGLPVA